MTIEAETRIQLARQREGELVASRGRRWRTVWSQLEQNRKKDEEPRKLTRGGFAREMRRKCIYGPVENAV
jgi:hypothetical protein